MCLVSTYLWHAVYDERIFNKNIIRTLGWINWMLRWFDLILVLVFVQLNATHTSLVSAVLFGFSIHERLISVSDNKESTWRVVEGRGLEKRWALLMLYRWGNTNTNILMNVDVCVWTVRTSCTQKKPTDLRWKAQLVRRVEPQTQH